MSFVMQGTAWNDASQSENGTGPINTPKFDIDGNPSSFSQAELKAILIIWRGGAWSRPENQNKK
jgi:hypothetical protein